jgi:porphobilinogen deaminase
VPIGAHATKNEAVLHLRAIVISPDGKRVVKSEAIGLDPVKMGDDVGQELLNKGAREILG